MSNKAVFVREYLPLNKLVNNTGQIEGVPKNPRFIRDDNFRALVEDMDKDPKMIELKEPWVFPLDGKYVVFAGNMRFRAAKDLKRKTIPCKVVSADSTAKEIRGWAIKDNIERGEHDVDLLANEWDLEELGGWGYQLPVWENSQDLDYSVLDDEEAQRQVDEMSNEVKKAIQIEFEKEDYEEAYKAIKKLREDGQYVGGVILKHIKQYLM
jgi:hypothetical protein